MIPWEFVLFASNVEHISMLWAALVFLGYMGICDSHNCIVRTLLKMQCVPLGCHPDMEPFN